ncbi:hypothetical protein B1748_05240 [Paenibacillus sp. MY03]|nr:hypothetical protein B1748_05240 [Paenibacillus sp. MY03]
MKWLASLSKKQTAASFGTCWVRGRLQPGEASYLEDDASNRIPVQTRINAYWPDGSVKWLLYSAVLDKEKGYQVSIWVSPYGPIRLESASCLGRIHPGGE